MMTPVTSATQHHQRRKTDDPIAKILPMQMQTVVKRIEELAADLQFVIRNHTPRARIDGRITEGVT